MKLIGITGPTGAGKTTALNVLTEFGGHVIDCDAVYHQLVASSEELRRELTGRFGPVFLPEGGLDRQKLGRLVFEDAEALADLNRITHFYVNEEVDRQIRRAAEEGRPAAAVDAIALLEGGLRDKCDVTVGIVAPPEVRLRRIMEREGISEDYARTRIAAQKPEQYYRDNCTYTIRNDGTPEEFAQKARLLFQKIIEE